MDGIHVLKNATIGVRTNSRIKAALSEIAEREGITLSSMLEDLAIKELRRRKVKLIVQTEILAY